MSGEVYAPLRNSSQLTPAAADGLDMSTIMPEGMQSLNGKVREPRNDEGLQYRLEEVLEQWYGPEHAFFKIRADGKIYVLWHETALPDGDWELV